MSKFSIILEDWSFNYTYFYNKKICKSSEKTNYFAKMSKFLDNDYQFKYYGKLVWFKVFLIVHDIYKITKIQLWMAVS